MDPNNIKNTTTSGCWDLDMNMGMGNHPLLIDQVFHMDLFHNMDQSQQATQLPPPNPLTTIPELGPPKEASFEKINEVDVGEEEEEGERLGAMKEMMYKIAAMQPVDIDPATIRKPKRRNVRISDDPQSIAARHRRERISERIRILQRLVPGGTKMDTASMLDEAIRYVKFLKRQVHELQAHELGTSGGLPVRPDGVGPSSMSAGGGGGSGLGFGFYVGDGSSCP